MDYKTKPTSRVKLRKLAKIFRQLFHVSQNGAFPVLSILEKVPDIFKGTTVIVVEDNQLPTNIPARCIQDGNGNFCIEIAEYVYNGAYKNKTGAFLGFICHEICHIFLYKLGFTPVLERNFKNNKLPAYCSVEWQAKALCGEIMMPYEETQDMSIVDLMRTYHVSRSFAIYRQNL